MIIGLVFITLGFVLMSGGGSDNPAVFNERYNKLVSLLKQKSPNIIIIPNFIIKMSESLN